MKALLILGAASFAWGYGSEVIAAAFAALGLLYSTFDQPNDDANKKFGCWPMVVLLCVFWLLIAYLFIVL